MADQEIIVRGFCDDIPRDQRSREDTPISDSVGPEEESCLICATIRSRRARLPCHHWWCRRCLREQVKHAIADRATEARWPPRCCEQGLIIYRLIRWMRDRQLKDDYDRQARMLDVPVQDRTFCCGQGCGEFIHPDQYRMLPGVPVGNGNWVGTCPRCRRDTCVACHGEAHAGTECPLPQDVLEQIERAVTERLQICWACGMLVHRTDGCIHMTCPCTHQFCWICGDEWPCRNEHAFQHADFNNFNARRDYFTARHREIIRRRQERLQMGAQTQPGMGDVNERLRQNLIQIEELRGQGRTGEAMQRLQLMAPDERHHGHLAERRRQELVTAIVGVRARRERGLADHLELMRTLRERDQQRRVRRQQERLARWEDMGLDFQTRRAQLEQQRQETSRDRELVSWDIRNHVGFIGQLTLGERPPFVTELLHWRRLEVLLMIEERLGPMPAPTDPPPDLGGEIAFRMLAAMPDIIRNDRLTGLDSEMRERRLGWYASDAATGWRFDELVFQQQVRDADARGREEDRWLEGVMAEWHQAITRWRDHWIRARRRPVM